MFRLENVVYDPKTTVFRLLLNFMLLLDGKALLAHLDLFREDCR